jgi:hypothetical protein
MKRTVISSLVLTAVAALFLCACSRDESYAEKKEKERDAIKSFLQRDVSIMFEGDTVLHVGTINVIDEDQFLEQDSTTNVERNEYVLFGNTGVYMQIVRKGVGGKLESGDSKRVIARYLEYNIMGDSIQTRNNILYYSTTPDVIDITNNYGSFTASFNIDNGGGAMYRSYNSTSVPPGWLVPFSYIHIGRQVNENDEIAKVRLILPHSQGQKSASEYVYPCFYEITFQQMRD